MSLSTGRGPHGLDPAGRFVPADLGLGRATYVEPFLRRVRGLSGERTLIDSERVLLVHRPAQPPTYAFPERDVSSALATSPEPAAPGYVRVAWDAVAAWYEEDERVEGHPKNPYHRIDCLRAKRHLRVEVDSQVLVDTTDVIALFETSRAPVLYVRRELVRMDWLVPSQTTSYCPYKGHASYWTARVGETTIADVAWSYDDPYPESASIAGLLSFYADRAQSSADVLSWFAVPVTPTGAHG